MSYAMTMYQRAMRSESLEHIIPVLERSGKETDFPINKPYVSFGTEYEQGEYLLGSDSPLMKEIMTVTVSAADTTDGEYCRALAKEVCMNVVNLDEDKRIISINAGNCRYDAARCAYTISMKFGLSGSCEQ